MAQVMWGIPKIRDAFQEYYRGCTGQIWIIQDE